MRELADKARSETLLRQIGERATGPGSVYIVGGSSAVLIGWRATTKDVDLKLDPEPPGVFEAIRDLKRGKVAKTELLALLEQVEERQLGLDVPPGPAAEISADQRLYLSLVRRLGRGAGYRAYSALVERLVSFTDALAAQRARERRAAAR